MARRNRLGWTLGATAVAAAAAAGVYLGLRWRVVPLTMIPCPECPLGIELYRGRSSWHGSHSAADLAAQRKVRQSDAATGMMVVHTPLGGQEAYYEVYGSGGVRVDLSVITPLIQPRGSIFDLPRLPRQNA